MHWIVGEATHLGRHYGEGTVRTDSAAFDPATGTIVGQFGSGSPFVFVAATVLLAAIPLLLLIVLGQRAQTLLPKIRNWMTANSWIVSEILIAFFLAMTVKNLFAG